MRLFMVRMAWDDAEEMYGPVEETEADLLDFCPKCGKLMREREDASC